MCEKVIWTVIDVDQLTEEPRGGLEPSMEVR